MPTVIVLDVSLSMIQPVIVSDANETDKDYVCLNRSNLAVHGINVFLDFLATHAKLEFVALMIYSSLFEVICQFTRDYEFIKSKLVTVEEFDKSNIENAMEGVNQLVLSEWGNNTPCQILWITDGKLGTGPNSLKHTLAALNQGDASKFFPPPFAFPAKLTIAFITSPDDSAVLNNRGLFQRLTDIAGPDGALYIPESPLSLQSVAAMFQKIADDCYSSFHGTISCGNMKSRVHISPTPMPYTLTTDFSINRFTVLNDIKVCGFISVADIGSPMAVSRHLVLPLPTNPTVSVIKSDITEAGSEGEDTMSDEGKAPSFCVLLHGALKVENMAALVQLNENWFGFLYSWADTKKKSNLMLTVMIPGADCVPWLGNLNNLSVLDESQISENMPMFPVKPVDKKSYSQNCVVWIKQSGLQSDIQKILRHARKLPEKTQQFYKELNRLRRAAISLGFMELLDGLAVIFERECTLLPSNVHPDATIQLSHATAELRKLQNRDIKINIVPLHTKFSSIPQP